MPTRWTPLIPLASLSLALLAALALPGCGEPPSSEDDVPTLRFGVSSENESIDPAGTTAMIDFRLMDMAFEPLVEIDPATGDVKPAAAEAWTVSDDGLVYTFTLRDDAKWSNGDDVTAGDFAFAWKRAIWPDYAAQYTNLFDHIQGVVAFRDQRAAQAADFTRITGGDANAQKAQEMLGIAEDLWTRSVGIEVVDERTLRVTLERPTAYFIELCAFGTFMPVHAASVADAEPLDPNTGQYRRDQGLFVDPDRIVCNGPYMLTKWDSIGVIQFEQNPHYHSRDAMNNQRVMQRHFKDQASMLLAYNEGELDWVPGLDTSTSQTISMVQQANAGERDDVHIVNAAGTYFYRFNHRETVDDKPNPFVDGRVGLALTLCLDRDRVVNRISRGGEEPYTTLVPDCIPGYTPPADADLLYDPDRARQLLADAGYPGGEGFPQVEFLYNSDSPIHEQIALYAQEAWRNELGIEVGMNNMIFKQLLQSLNEGNFFIGRAGWYGDYRDPTTWLDMFRTGDGNNDGEYSNPEYDALLNRALVETDAAARFEILEEAEAMLLNDGAIAPIMRYTSVHLFDPARVTGLHPNAWNIFEIEKVTVTQ